MALQLCPQWKRNAIVKPHVELKPYYIIPIPILRLCYLYNAARFIFICLWVPARADLLLVQYTHIHRPKTHPPTVISHLSVYTTCTLLLRFVVFSFGFAHVYILSHRCASALQSHPFLFLCRVYLQQNVNIEAVLSSFVGLKFVRL